MKYLEKEKLKSIPVEQAVGKMLLHDITRIIPDMFKGPCFKKGHIITVSDVETLLDLGKRHVYVTGLENDVHENEAAERIANAAAGAYISLTQPEEGKVGFVAEINGLLKINLDGLNELNAIPDVIFATLHSFREVEKEKSIAGTRVVPLTIPARQVEEAETVCRRYFPIIEVKPFARTNVGLLVTGSEVYNGRIRDGFGPVVQKKFEALGSRIMEKKIVPDDLEMTVSAIRRFIDAGAGMVAVTGGMSVDPDDLTPSAIRAAGGEIITYGAPVLPGAMFMLAYIGRVPVIGLPGCVMYCRASIFDLVVPRLLAGEPVSKQDIIMMGHGGLCASCNECRYPDCSFGK